MQKITTFITYESRAEEAMNFYMSVFKKNAKPGSMMPGPDGKFMGGTFKLYDQEFFVLNGGPHFKFTDGFSLFVSAETQEEIDELWEKLTEGGQESRCGWLKDKFGVSWQIVPPILSQLLGDKDRAKAGRVMEAMMKMSKIEIKLLKDAAAGK